MPAIQESNTATNPAALRYHLIVSRWAVGKRPNSETRKIASRAFYRIALRTHQRDAKKNAHHPHETRHVE